VENETDYAAWFKNSINYRVVSYIQKIYRTFFLYALCTQTQVFIKSNSALTGPDGYQIIKYS
jgi:hypothetical protein